MWSRALLRKHNDVKQTRLAQLLTINRTKTEYVARVHRRCFHDNHIAADYLARIGSPYIYLAITEYVPLIDNTKGAATLVNANFCFRSQISDFLALCRQRASVS